LETYTPNSETEKKKPYDEKNVLASYQNTLCPVNLQKLSTNSLETLFYSSKRKIAETQPA